MPEGGASQRRPGYWRISTIRGKSKDAFDGKIKVLKFARMVDI